MDNISLGWAAYAAGIAVLGGLSGLAGNSHQRFAITPQNSFSLPIVQNTGAAYQAFALRNLVGIVPTADAVYTSTLQYWDTALKTYLTYATPVRPSDANLNAELAQAKADQNAALAEASDMIWPAMQKWADYTPGGKYIFTGQPISFNDFCAIWYPQLLDDQEYSAELNILIQRLNLEASAAQQTIMLNQWLDAVQKGANQTVSYPGFNTPGNIASAADLAAIAQGSQAPATTAGTYVPTWSIGGGYNTVAQNWINTFPKDYPTSNVAYNKGASTYIAQSVQGYNNFWANYGYSTSTHVTGANLIFFSWKDATTHTTQTASYEVQNGEFGPSIQIRAWGIGSFPVSPGSWYNGNPLSTFPQLLANGTPPFTAQNVQEMVTSVVMGYGIEVQFNLFNQTFNELYGHYTTSKQNSGYMSVFGWLYGSGGGSYSSTTQSWDKITFNNNTQSITLTAQADGVPQLLGVIITNITQT